MSGNQLLNMDPGIGKLDRIRLDAHCYLSLPLSHLPSLLQILLHCFFFTNNDKKSLSNAILDLSHDLKLNLTYLLSCVIVQNLKVDFVFGITM